MTFAEIVVRCSRPPDMAAVERLATASFFHGGTLVVYVLLAGGDPVAAARAAVVEVLRHAPGTLICAAPVDRLPPDLA